MQRETEHCAWFWPRTLFRQLDAPRKGSSASRSQRPPKETRLGCAGSLTTPQKPTSGPPMVFSVTTEFWYTCRPNRRFLLFARAASSPSLDNISSPSLPLHQSASVARPAEQHDVEALFGVAVSVGLRLLDGGCPNHGFDVAVVSAWASTSLSWITNLPWPGLQQMRAGETRERERRVVPGTLDRAALAIIGASASWGTPMTDFAKSSSTPVSRRMAVIRQVEGGFAPLK